MIDFATHPWMRGLFGDADLIAIFAPDADLKRMLKVEAAWTRALGTTNAATDTNAIAARIETTQITPEDLHDGFARDGVPIPALVDILKSQNPHTSAPWIHTGLTSQDVMDTSLMLALQEALGVIQDRLETLGRKLETLQTKFGPNTIMAYTRMQPALETQVSAVIRCWQQPLARLAQQLKQTKTQVAQIQWGGPIGGRSHPNAASLGKAFAKGLDLTDPGTCWHTDRGMITEVAHRLVQITTLTGKIGEDIALMAALGPAQISLVGGNSSAMPHKNNPIKAETLVTLSDYAGTLQLGITRSARHEAQRSGRAWMLEWLTMPQLCIVAGASLVQACHLIETIERMGKQT